MPTAIAYQRVLEKEEHIGLTQLLRPTSPLAPTPHAVMWRSERDAGTIDAAISCAQGVVDFQFVEVPWIRKLMLRVPLHEYFDEPRHLRLTASQGRALSDALSSAQLMTDDELRAREEQLQRETAFIE